MRTEKAAPLEKWLIAGIPIIFIAGSFMHFLYELSGKNKLIGLIAPVNESVWEHTKMVVLPIILFWTVIYFICGKKYRIDKDKCFTGALASLLAAIIAIPLLFYFYTEAFGIESVIIDIIILFLAILIGQLAGIHIYRNSAGIAWYIPVILMILIVILYMFLTYYPIKIPIFLDSQTGRYGIGK